MRWFGLPASLHGREQVERYPGRAEHDSCVTAHGARPVAGSPWAPYHSRVRCRYKPRNSLGIVPRKFVMPTREE